MSAFLFLGRNFRNKKISISDSFGQNFQAKCKRFYEIGNSPINYFQTQKGESKHSKETGLQNQMIKPLLVQKSYRPSVSENNVYPFLEERVSKKFDIFPNPVTHLKSQYFFENTTLIQEIFLFLSIVII